ncbi:hypothetical protein TRVA0_019S00628 [Trichomonascus vanleenenianus]|uniref:uncharacterized protein n=1 Tax=Trichomonascus vanleenenianus TaxID=2268995 RepID=UPI003ECA25BB
MATTSHEHRQASPGAQKAHEDKQKDNKHKQATPKKSPRMSSAAAMAQYNKQLRHGIYNSPGSPVVGVSSTSSGEAALLATQSDLSPNLWQRESAAPAAGTAALLATQSNKSPQIWKPDSSATAATAALYAKDHPSTVSSSDDNGVNYKLESASAKAALQAHKTPAAEMAAQALPEAYAWRGGESTLEENEFKGASVKVFQQDRENQLRRSKSLGSSEHAGFGNIGDIEETARQNAAQRLSHLNATKPSIYATKPSEYAGLGVGNKRDSMASSHYSSIHEDDNVLKNSAAAAAANILMTQKREEDRRHQQQLQEALRQHDALMTAARARAESSLSEIDRRVLEKNPLADTRFNAAAYEIAEKKGKERMENHGKINIGGGMFMTQSEIEAIAQRNVAPVLSEISERAEQQRQDDEVRRLAEEEERAHKAEDQRIGREKKAEEKRIKHEEKEKKRALQSQQKQAEREKKQKLKAEKKELKEQRKHEKMRLKGAAAEAQNAEAIAKTQVQKTEATKQAAEAKAAEAQILAEQAETPEQAAAAQQQAEEAQRELHAANADLEQAQREHTEKRELAATHAAAVEEHERDTKEKLAKLGPVGGVAGAVAGVGAAVGLTKGAGEKSPSSSVSSVSTSSGESTVALELGRAADVMRTDSTNASKFAMEQATAGMALKSELTPTSTQVELEMGRAADVMQTESTNASKFAIEQATAGMALKSEITPEPSEIALEMGRAADVMRTDSTNASKFALEQATAGMALKSDITPASSQIALEMGRAADVMQTESTNASKFALEQATAGMALKSELTPASSVIALEQAKAGMALKADLTPGASSVALELGRAADVMRTDSTNSSKFALEQAQAGMALKSDITPSSSVIAMEQAKAGMALKSDITPSSSAIALEQSKAVGGAYLPSESSSAISAQQRPVRGIASTEALTEKSPKAPIAVPTAVSGRTPAGQPTAPPPATESDKHRGIGGFIRDTLKKANPAGRMRSHSTGKDESEQPKPELPEAKQQQESKHGLPKFLSRETHPTTQKAPLQTASDQPGAGGLATTAAKAASSAQPTTEQSSQFQTHADIHAANAKEEERKTQKILADKRTFSGFSDTEEEEPAKSASLEEVAKPSQEPAKPTEGVFKEEL